ncbi:S1C family serine protease [Olegusella massiliensis]|uniref:S1C family serine protease n=1 Tax=Olegusella massiliensis TaxID=1776381 RepID=UPI0003ADC8E0|nr:trypsin-like peptidase domain-containing protein [Olegusella massiliensis]ERL12593.1 PDZ domain protein [Coriobacteriaceae bacterium BV3Ac1]
MSEFDDQPIFDKQSSTSEHSAHVNSATQATAPQPCPTQNYGGAANGLVGDQPITASSEHNAHKKKRSGAKHFLQGVLGGAVGAGALVAILLGTGTLGSKVVTPTPGSSNKITINASGENASIARAVATKCLPSVVSIGVKTPRGGALGSGVILDKKGNIVTNYHVVENAQSITVDIEGKTYNAKVVGSDSSSDIAVIKVDLKGARVTPIDIADSDKLVVGDWVMAIGSPFGLNQSVSTGIVSALYRSTLLPSSSGTTVYANLIQIDAAINQGNSGGALVNDKGELVGINTLVESSSGDFSGIGFSIPGNYAVNIAKKIIAGEKVTHAYIGVSMLTVNSQNSSGLAVDKGAYVAQVDKDGPAAEAGIKKGDIITAIDDDKISSADGVILSIRSHAEGDKVKVTVNRDGKEESFTVTLGNDEELQTQQQLMRNNPQDNQNSQDYNPFEGFGE